ncbi:MAG TPA: C2H2-type zinc finger protein [Nitrososphaeraceae archaeon]|nr:C2H2-type zinc finger protein [Nitrososphaeraceae archaeon]
MKARNTIKSQSQEEEVKRLRFPCSYCSRRFKTLEEVKRHIRYAHTPRCTT